MSGIRWSKIATQASLTFGFIASIPINLASSWFQQDIISNKFLSISVIIMLAALFYLVLRMRAPRYLAIATATFVAGIFLNLLSWWVQEYPLHNSFTISNVLVILSVAGICSIMNALLASHPIRSYTRRRTYRLRRKAKKSSVSLATKGKFSTRKKPPARKKKIRRGFWT